MIVIEIKVVMIYYLTIQLGNLHGDFMDMGHTKILFNH